MSIVSKLAKAASVAFVVTAYSVMPGCSSQSILPQEGGQESVGTVSSAITASTELTTDTSATDETQAAIASNGSRSLVVWKDTRSSGVLMGALVDINGSGNPVLVTGLAGGNPFQISTLLGPTGPTPSIAWDGTNFFVVWSTRRAINQFTLADIRGARVSPAGVVLDTTPIDIYIQLTEQTTPKVVFGGGQYVVVWDDAQSGVSQIYGARVTTAGVVTDTTPKLLVAATTPNTASKPSIASDGTNYLLTCIKTSGGPIWTERLDSTLTVSAGTALSGDTSVAPLTIWTGLEYYVTYVNAIEVTGARFNSAGAQVGSALALWPTSLTTLALAPTGDNATALIFWSNPFALNDYRVSRIRVVDGATVDETPFTATSDPGSIAYARVGSRVVATYDVASAVPKQSNRVRAFALTGAAVGTTCTLDSQCGSGACITGKCCNEGCNVACRTCSVTPGTCTNIVNQDDALTCTGTKTCSSSGVCLTKTGQTCASNGACLSGNCADSTCCDTACANACDRCNLAGKAGTCTPATVGTSGSPACGSNFLCDGTATACPLSCTNDAMCAAGTYCNSVGKCVAQLPQASACNLAVDCKAAGCRECATGTTCTDGFCCGTACTSACQTCSATPGTCTTVTSNDDTDTCTGASTCNAGGSCVAKLGLGKSCSVTSDCTSGQCVDNVCCDTACSGSCDRCNLTGKEGTCSPAIVGTVGAAPACGTNILCDGINTTCQSTCTSDAMCPAGTFCNAGGQCQAQVPQAQACNLTADCKVAGTCRECATGNCADGFCCDSACSGSCDNCSATPGTCTLTAKGDKGTPSCAPYVCDGTAATCGTTCTQNSDCGAGANCDIANGKCQGSDPNGTTCTKDDTCLSQHCVDGVCCDTACEGQCQACDVATSKGTCSPVVGVPHGKRTACAGATGGDACTARVCDGAKDTTSCVGYVGSEVGCRDASCKDGTETASDSCNGAGKCGSGTPVTRQCAPYACGATGCNATCTSDAECASGTVCDVATKKCGGTASCVDDFTVKSANGTVESCNGYRCQGGACSKACASIKDCAGGYTCAQSADGQLACIVDPTSVDGGGVASEPPPDDCSCQTPGARYRSGGFSWAALALGFVFLRRRQRRGPTLSRR